jgi:hypothetical protein
MEEVESSQDSLKGYHYDRLSEDMARNHLLESPHTQAKWREDKNFMRAIWSLQLERILEHSNHVTTWVI